MWPTKVRARSTFVAQRHSRPTVVYNSAHDRSKVALICGGGSGHEPAHAGYVGEGILAGKSRRPLFHMGAHVLIFTPKPPYVVPSSPLRTPAKSAVGSIWSKMTRGAWLPLSRGLRACLIDCETYRTVIIVK